MLLKNLFPFIPQNFKIIVPIVLLSSAPFAPVLAVDLQVGIVQRFGEEKEDQLTIRSTTEDQLQLIFKDISANNSDTSKTIRTNQVVLQIKPQTLSTGKIEERLILGDHATFETAEDDANRWRKLGIEVEITQPGRWQVWAKRDVYHNPLLKRLLLQTIKAEEKNEQVYIESSYLIEKPQVAFTVGEKTHQVTNLEITTAKNLVQVQDGKDGKNRLYGGKLIIQPNAYGDYTLVNKVDIETYLRGVVPHEIGGSAPLAAAEAQTIIARTYALRNTRRFVADNYQLCATTHCQVYYGIGETSPQSDRAINATRGLVLTYENELVDALYYSTSGGVTAPFSDTWNGNDRPYLKSVIDAPQPMWDLAKFPLNVEANLRRFISMKSGFNEDGRRLFRWDRSRSINDLNSDLRKYLERIRHPLVNFTTIENMTITKRSTSGRILELMVKTDLGVVSLKKNEVRSAFQPPISTLFYLEPVLSQNKKIEGYRFIGGGFGHGVGLSQFGSYNLANRGKNFRDILQFYYPGAKVEPLNDSIIWWQ
ncbi:MAG: SpoIID/LytB domain-containing protein [Cyanobacterium sp. T60_A2020_053]|nr:SpoIID/LytB domain-containing protein [Cyanobacterium sp. T60_A2020_053]